MRNLEIRDRKRGSQEQEEKSVKEISQIKQLEKEKNGGHLITTNLLVRENRREGNRRRFFLFHNPPRCLN